METGLKTIQTTNTLESHSIKELSIQISLSGLSFCILDRNELRVDYLKQVNFKNKVTPEAVLDRLTAYINTEPIFEQDFDKVLILYQNDLSNLVPEEFFEADNAADYLKFSNRILKTDFISHDKIELNKSINVFVPYVNINNYLFEVFGEFEYKHASSVLIENILKQQKFPYSDELHINVDQYSFELVAIKKGELLLYNSFEYFSREDFIYYVLFTMEQLKLDPETTQIKLTGQLIKSDAMYQLLFTYIRHVDFEPPSTEFKGVLGSEKHFHTLILNSFN